MILTLVIPDCSEPVRSSYVQFFPDLLSFQPRVPCPESAPPGTTASIRTIPEPFLMITRAPFVMGSMLENGGAPAITNAPLRLNLSLSGTVSLLTLPTISFGLGLVATKFWPPATLVQTSIASHWPSPSESGRVPLGGHDGSAPLHVAATSHGPADTPQTTVPGSNALPGQSGLAPSQVSSMSHTPWLGRQTAPGLPAECWQIALAPSHASTVQALPSSAQIVPIDLKWQSAVQHDASVPFSAPSSHCSPASTA